MFTNWQRDFNSLRFLCGKKKRPLWDQLAPCTLHSYPFLRADPAAIEVLALFYLPYMWINVCLSVCMYTICIQCPWRPGVHYLLLGWSYRWSQAVKCACWEQNLVLCKNSRCSSPANHASGLSIILLFTNIYYHRLEIFHWGKHHVNINKPVLVMLIIFYRHFWNLIRWSDYCFLQSNSFLYICF